MFIILAFITNAVSDGTLEDTERTGFDSYIVAAEHIDDLLLHKELSKGYSRYRIAANHNEHAKSNCWNI